MRCGLLFTLVSQLSSTKICAESCKQAYVNAPQSLPSGYYLCSVGQQRILCFGTPSPAAPASCVYRSVSPIQHCAVDFLLSSCTVPLTTNICIVFVVTVLQSASDRRKVVYNIPPVPTKPLDPLAPTSWGVLIHRTLGDDEIASPLLICVTWYSTKNRCT